MNDVLIFWRPRADLAMEPAATAQELTWGEEVEGLVDLPIKAIIDRLKAEFPRHRETAGHLALEMGTGRAEATWTWQHLRVELAEASEEDRGRLIAAIEEFDCTVHEA
jgi:hypothetical protein